MRSLTTLTLLVCLAQLFGISRVACRYKDEEQSASSEKELRELAMLASRTYNELVGRKVDCADWLIKPKLKVFKDLEEKDKKRSYTRYKLPLPTEYAVSMYELFSFDNVICFNIRRRENEVIANKELVSPALYRYLKKATDELSARCLEKGRMKIIEFQEKERDNWRLIEEFNELANNHGVSEQAGPDNGPLLEDAIHEFLTRKLAKIKCKHEEEPEVALKFARKLEEACRSFRTPEEIWQVKTIHRESVRSWIRYERICKQFINHSLDETMERIKSPLIRL